MPVLTEEFYAECWDHWEKTRDWHYVVQQKMPNPYVGDVGAYQKAALRVVTVGLNPNREIRKCTMAIKRLSGTETERRLSIFFAEQRGVSGQDWFSNYEAVLGGMGLSYYAANDGILHVDLCSPIATVPTWSRLNVPQKKALLSDGRKIFRSLIETLAPDVILASVNKQEIAEHWGDPSNDDWSTLVSYSARLDGTPRTSRYDVRVNTICKTDGKVVRVVYAPASQKPFLSISRVQQKEVGQRLRRLLEVI